MGLDKCGAGRMDRKGLHGILVLGSVTEARPPAIPDACFMCHQPQPLLAMVAWADVAAFYSMIEEEEPQEEEEPPFPVDWLLDCPSVIMGDAVRIMAMSAQWPNLRGTIQSHRQTLDQLTSWDTILRPDRLMDARAVDTILDYVTCPNMEVIRSRSVFGYTALSGESALSQTTESLEYRGGYVWLLARHVTFMLYWVTAATPPPLLTLHLLDENGRVSPGMQMRDEPEERRTLVHVGADWAILHIPSTDGTARLLLSLASLREHPQACFFLRGTVAGFGTLVPPRVQREAYPVLPVSPLVSHLLGSMAPILPDWIMGDALPQTSFMDDVIPAKVASRDIGRLEFMLDKDVVTARLGPYQGLFFKSAVAHILVVDAYHMYRLVHQPASQWRLGAGARPLDAQGGLAPGWIVEPLGGAAHIRAALMEALGARQSKTRIQQGIYVAMGRQHGIRSGPHESLSLRHDLGPPRCMLSTNPDKVGAHAFHCNRTEHPPT
jgi:hypothetical protein